ncbi:MAG: helix-turn-helix transcriptional regulator [Firmicutes bacterium]|nr:helix-turn-helix transcriptional regulator [Bacillota bacterium]
MTRNKATRPPCGDRCPCTQSCPQQRAWEILGGKWKLPLLCSLAQDGATRYSDLKRKIGGITNTMLSGSLKELERDGLVRRVQHDEMPVRVEYSLTDKGSSVIPILNALALWSVEQLPEQK